MPNHIMNRVHIDTDDQTVLDKIKKYTEGDDGDLSVLFGKIIPEPEYDETTDWYTWRLKHWGTKWGGYWGSLDGSQLTFYTAWSTPAPIIKALSEKFPDIEFEVYFYDEDLGYNLGNYVYENGAVLKNYAPEGGSPEAYAFLEEHFDEVVDEDYRQ